MTSSGFILITRKYAITHARRCQEERSRVNI